MEGIARKKDDDNVGLFLLLLIIIVIAIVVMTKGMFTFTYDLNMSHLNSYVNTLDSYVNTLKSFWDIDFRYFFNSQDNVNVFLEKGFATGDSIFKSNYNII